MSKAISSMYVTLGGSISGLSKSFKAAIAPVKSVQSAVASASSSLGGLASSAIKVAGIGTLIGSAFAAIKGAANGITLAAELEQTTVAFETMLRSATQAQALMEQLKSFAAETPFQFPEVAKSAKQLLAYGFSAGEITSRLTMLGDVASGISAPIEDIVYLFGTVRTQSKAMTKDLYQFANRGIPIFRMLAEEMHTTEAGVFKMAEEGKISFAIIDSAFRKLTSGGGQFAEMMKKQSQTMSGLWSTLSDTVGLTMAKATATIYRTFRLDNALRGLTSGTKAIGALLNSAVARWSPIIKSFAMSAWKSFQVLYRIAIPAIMAKLPAVRSAIVQLADAAMAGAAPFIRLGTIVAGVLLAGLRSTAEAAKEFVLTLSTLKSIVELTAFAAGALVTGYVAWRVASVSLSAATVALAAANVGLGASLIAVNGGTKIASAMQWGLLAAFNAAKAGTLALAGSNAVARAASISLAAAQTAMSAVMIGVQSVISTVAVVTRTLTIANWSAVAAVVRLTAVHLAKMAVYVAVGTVIYATIAATTAMTTAYLATRAAVASVTATLSASRAIITSLAAVTQVLAVSLFTTRGAFAAMAIASRLMTAAFVAGRTIIASLSVAAKAMAAAQIIWQGATIGATAAQWLLNVALTANPVGVVVVALGALAAGLAYAAVQMTSLEAIVSFSKKAFDIGAFAISNWKETLKVAFLEARYLVINFAENLKHFFTGVIPASIHWFADDWQAILKDLFSWTGTVISNLAGNVVKVLSSIPDLISGRLKFDELWTPLTEGFKRTSKELVLPQRQIGALEKSAGDAAKAAGDAWSKGLEAFRADRNKTPEEEWKGHFAKIRPPKLSTELTPKLATELPKLPAMDLDVKPKLGKAVISGSGEAQALRYGPQPIQSKGMKDLNKDMLAKQLAEATRQSKTLETIAKNTETAEESVVQF